MPVSQEWSCNYCLRENREDLSDFFKTIIPVKFMKVDPFLAFKFRNDCVHGEINRHILFLFIFYVELLIS